MLLLLRREVAEKIAGSEAGLSRTLRKRYLSMLIQAGSGNRSTYSKSTYGFVELIYVPGTFSIFYTAI